MTFLPPTPSYLEISSVLREICQPLQLNPYRHKKAEERYHGVASWLNEDKSSLKYLQGDIFSQGSFRIGTTVRPFSLDDTKTEYDLDFVCLFQATKAQVGNPVDFLNRLQRRLAENPHYEKLIEPNKRRCVRLNYADDFHMDILPAIPDPERPDSTCLLVPDREVKDWKPSNPVGYADWFVQRSMTISEKRELFEVESLPELQSLEEKTPLQVAVQLMKRRRDLVFLPNHVALLPVSIVLTTLAGRYYSGQSSPLDAIEAILQGLDNEIKLSTKPIGVRPVIAQKHTIRPIFVQTP